MLRLQTRIVAIWCGHGLFSCFFGGWKIRLPCRRVNGNVLLVMSVLCCPPRPRSLCPHPILMACVLLQGSLVFVACCRNVFASISLLHDLTLRPVLTPTNFNIKPSHQAAFTPAWPQKHRQLMAAWPFGWEDAGGIAGGH